MTTIGVKKPFEEIREYKRLDTVISKAVMDELEEKRQLLKTQYKIHITKKTMYNIVFYHFMKELHSDLDIAKITVEYLENNIQETKALYRIEKDDKH